MPKNFRIKGIREGLLISLGEGEWNELQKDLYSHLDQQKEFLQGGNLALDVGIADIPINGPRRRR